MGYRLTSKLKNDFYNLRSKIVIPGIVQFTPGGEMIIATADCQVTGGYLQILLLSIVCLLKYRNHQVFSFEAFSTLLIHNL